MKSPLDRHFARILDDVRTRQEGLRLFLLLSSPGAVIGLILAILVMLGIL